jgi:hypothetical protein
MEIVDSSVEQYAANGCGGGNGDLALATATTKSSAIPLHCRANKYCQKSISTKRKQLILRKLVAIKTVSEIAREATKKCGSIWLTCWTP